MSYSSENVVEQNVKCKDIENVPINEVENVSSNCTGVTNDADIALALSLSQKQHEEEVARIKQEEEILKQILELSLTEK